MTRTNEQVALWLGDVLIEDLKADITQVGNNYTMRLAEVPGYVQLSSATRIAAVPQQRITFSVTKEAANLYRFAGLVSEGPIFGTTGPTDVYLPTAANWLTKLTGLGEL